MQTLAGGRRLLGYCKRGRHSEKFGNHCYIPFVFKLSVIVVYYILHLCLSDANKGYLLTCYSLLLSFSSVYTLLFLATVSSEYLTVGVFAYSVWPLMMTTI